MEEMFEAESTVKEFERDRSVIDEFLVNAQKYSAMAKAGKGSKEIREEISRVRTVIDYWRAEFVTDANFTAARMYANGLENILCRVEGARNGGNGHNLNMQYTRARVEEAIAGKDEGKLKKAYAILEGLETSDENVGCVMRLIDAYFSNQEKAVIQRSQRKQEKKKRKKRKKSPAAQEPADVPETYDNGRYDDGDNCRSDVGSGAEPGQTALEKELENVKPVAEVLLPASYDAAPGNNGTGKPDSSNGIKAPLRSRGFDPKKSKFQPEVAPNYSFDDVVGLEDVKEKIKVKVVYPFTMPELAKNLDISGGGGLVLYGPPGTGKTSIAKAVAGDLGLPFFNMEPEDFEAHGVDKTVANIREFFEVLRSYERCVAFFDEADVMFRANPNTKKDRRINATFQKELSGYSSSDDSGSLLIVATNKPWVMEDALMRSGRFGNKVYVGFPDVVAREGLYRLKLEKMGVADDVDPAKLAEWTVFYDKDKPKEEGNKKELYTGADINAICLEAAETVFIHAAKTQEILPINMQLLVDMIDKINPDASNPNAYDARKMNDFRNGV